MEDEVEIFRKEIFRKSDFRRQYTESLGLGFYRE